MTAPVPVEQLLAALRSQRAVGIALVDDRLRYLEVNDFLAALNGASPAEHLGRTIRDVLPDAADEIEPLVRQALEGRAVVDHELRAPDGRRFLVNYLPVGTAPAPVVIGLVVETTASRRAQVAVRVAQERLALALEGTETGSFEWDARTDEVRWSETMGPLWGRPRGWQPATYAEYLSTVHPDDRPALEAAVRAAREDGTGYTREFRCLWPDGGVRWLQSRIHVVFEDDRPAILVGLVIDTDERRRRELAAEFVARASLALATSLDLRATLQQVADLAVPHLADWCAVHLAADGGAPQRVAVAASDAGRADLARQLNERYPPSADAPTGIPAVVRSGRSEFYPDIPDELLEAVAVDAEHLELLRRLGMRSAMLVPMMARGRTVGAISFASGALGRSFGTAELELAEELGRRAGLAVDNARLQEAQQAAARRLRQLQVVTDVALSHLDLDALLGELLARLREVAGAHTASVLLMDADRRELVVRAAEGPGAVAPVGTRWPVHEALASPEDPGAAAVRAQVATGRPLVRRRDGDTETVGVALRAGDAIVGVLEVSTAADQGFRPDELDLLERAADRAAVAIDHARVYEHVRDTAVTLQRSLLPRALPAVPGFEVAVRYLAGQAGTEVGGDWYDVFAGARGGVHVVVGDVAGRGVGAAATMGQLRAALRAHAVDRGRPGPALDGLDGFIGGLGGVGFATVALLGLDPVTGRGRLSLAGHPPPVLRRADGRAELLDVEPGAPIGAGPGERPSCDLVLAPGDMLLLYTDGLVERRDRRIDGRLAELVTCAAGSPADPESFLDAVLEGMLDSASTPDDVAVVALRRA